MRIHVHVYAIKLLWQTTCSQSMSAHQHHSENILQVVYSAGLLVYHLFCVLVNSFDS